MANGRNRTPYRVGDTEKVLGEMWVVTLRTETLEADGSRKLVLELGPAEAANAEVEAVWAAQHDHHPGVTTRSTDDPAAATYVVERITLSISEGDTSGLRMTLVDLMTSERERMDKAAHRDAIRLAARVPEGC